MMSKSEIDALTVGDYVQNCFGKLAPIVEIHHRGLDIHGKTFICFYTAFGPTSRISGSLKEGEAALYVE